MDAEESSQLDPKATSAEFSVAIVQFSCTCPFPRLSQDKHKQDTDDQPFPFLSKDKLPLA